MSNPSTQLEVFSKPGDLAKFLERGKSAIEAALPHHLNADRMMRLAITSFSTTPQLRDCTGQSILASIVVASQLGLEPGIAGQGYLIPYKRTCTFVPGWQGLVGLLNNSGAATAWTGAVFEGDEWDFQLGSAPRCAHRPGPNFGEAKKLTWVYACGKVNGAEQAVVEAWPISRVWKHRDQFNKVGARHYSYQHPEMYARKVVLLQVLKYMPRSIELNNAITASHAAEMNHATRVEDGVVIDMGDIDSQNRAPLESTPLAGAHGMDDAGNATAEQALADFYDAIPTASTGKALADLAKWAEANLSDKKKADALEAINKRAVEAGLVWSAEKGAFVEP